MAESTHRIIDGKGKELEAIFLFSYHNFNISVSTFNNYTDRPQGVVVVYRKDEYMEDFESIEDAMEFIQNY